jgi:hypothetical protein
MACRSVAPRPACVAGRTTHASTQSWPKLASAWHDALSTHVILGKDMGATDSLLGPSRDLTVWAALKEIGVEGTRDRVGRHLGGARRVADLVRADDRLELVARSS